VVSVAFDYHRVALNCAVLEAKKYQTRKQALQNLEYLLDLTGANHLPGIREPHAVSPAIRYDDSTRSFVCFMARPVALEL
jgi:hypothetical protein